MSTKVRIPTQLRSLTDGASELQIDGGNVKEIIDALEQLHPGIARRLLDEEGRLRRFVNVYVDEEDVRFLQGLETAVPEGASLSIIPAVAGGALR